MMIRLIWMKFFTIIFFCFILFSCKDSVESPYAAISFEKKSVMPGTGRASAVAFAIDGKGYVALGRTGVRTGALSDCWEFAPDSNKWTQKAFYPGTPRVKAMAAVVNGLAYVGLGFDINYGYFGTTGHLKDFWCFDPKVNKWTQRDSFPSEYTDACVSFVYKNEIYVGSGFDGDHFGNDFWKYNPTANKWVGLTNIPGRGRVGTLFCSDGEHVYFGTGYHTVNMNDWWEYFPETDSWKQMEDMPDNGRENGVSLSINNRYFVATGRYFQGTLTGGHVKSDVYEYDAVLNVWYKRGDIPASGRENAISFTIGGKGYIGFGENDEGVLNDLWSFEP